MYRTIIVAVALFNKGATSRGLIERANRLVSDGGSITLVHVLDDLPAYLADAMTQEAVLNHRKAIREQLDSLAATAQAARVDIDIRAGSASPGILALAQEINADLIMLASHKPDLSDYFIGSTASRVVRHAQCSVLVAR
jgi:nucleotide-binding universal stress UspA family protein